MPLKLQWDHVIITNMSVGRTQARSAFMLRSSSCRSAPHTCAHTQGDWNPLSSWERLCIEWGNCSVCILTNPAGDTCVHAHSKNTSSQAYAGASKQGEETVTKQRTPSPHRYNQRFFLAYFLYILAVNAVSGRGCVLVAGDVLKPIWSLVHTGVFFILMLFIQFCVKFSIKPFTHRQKPFLLILMINNWAHL